MSNNLDIDQVAESQNQSHITINDANAQLDAKLTEQITVDVTSLDVTLTDNQFRRNRAIKVTGATTTGRSVLIPQIKGSIEIISDAANTEDFNVVRGSTTTVVSPGQIKNFLTDGTVDGVLVTGGSSSTGGSITFLGLTDTPGTFAGNANKVVKVDAGGTQLEFGEANFLSKAHRGCVLRLTSNVVLPDPSSTVIGWGAEDFDTDDFHDNVTNNSRITIPAGITKVKLSYAFYANDIDSGGWSQAYIRKNGEAEPGRGFSSEDMSTDSTGGNQGFLVSTPVLEVVAGDYFEVFHEVNTGGGTLTINTGNATYFTCEVVEDDQVVSVGADDFTDLGDTPASYVGLNNQLVKVNSTATGIDTIVNSILSLTDTPGTFGSVGQVLKVNGTEDGLEWADDNTGGGGGGSFMGAFVSRGTQSQSIGTLGSPRFEFDNEIYDDGGFFDSGSSVTKITIPSGVTRVKLRAGIEFQSSAITDGETLQLQFFKNGAVMTPRIRSSVETSTGFNDFTAQIKTPVLAVTAGDYFELVGNFEISAALIQDDCWMSIEAV